MPSSRSQLPRGAVHLGDAALPHQRDRGLRRIAIALDQVILMWLAAFSGFI
jgi:hypothetical protein